MSARPTGFLPDLLIPYYHLASEEELPHVRPLYAYKTPRAFRRDLDFLLRRFRPVSLPEVLRRVLDGAPFTRPSLLLTIDDGLREAHEVMAPILAEKGVPAALFLCPGLLDNAALAPDHKAALLSPALGTPAPALLRRERQDPGALDRLAAERGVDLQGYLEARRPYLTREQAGDLLRRGFALGSHGPDHRPLEDLARPRQVEEVAASVRRVRSLFSLDYGAFSFPYSDRRISQGFFRDLEKAGSTDLTFGNTRFGSEPTARHLQRVNLERGAWPAWALLARDRAKTTAKRALGRIPSARPA